MNILGLLNKPESKTLEFKRDVSSLVPIIKTTIAFANTSGGVIIIGKSPDGELVGLEDPLLAEEKLANAFSDSIVPSLMPSIDIFSHQHKSFLIVTVAHQSGPFYLKRKGETEGVYIRFGSTTRKATKEAIAEMHRFQSGLFFDQLPCNTLGEEGLDQKKISRFFETLGKKVSTEKMESLGILTTLSGKRFVTNGGLILFGTDILRERHFPNSKLFLARFKGISKSSFIDRHESEGTIIEAIDDGIKFIRRNTRLSTNIESFKRQDLPEYPEIAIREVLTNALVHADYSLSGHIQVAIYDDRLEIQNPGMLPFGLTIEDLQSGVSRVRNRTIARVFRELELIEEWGSGYLRSTEFCQKYGYPIPKWQEVGSSIRVVFRPHNLFVPIDVDVPIKDVDVPIKDVDVPIKDVDVTIKDVDVPINLALNERQIWFLEMISKGYEIRSPDLSKHWKVTNKTAKRDISYLQEHDLISFTGSRKTGFYILKKKTS
jgi:ATP-dependent DNA helicase RecG